MSLEPTNGTDRRTFLQAGALATAAAVGMTPELLAQQGAGAKALPKRTLGRTGLEVTMLEMGTGARPESLQLLLRLSFAQGVRFFDTARAYGTEPAFKAWFQQFPEVRKQVVLVTKDNPGTPKDLIRMLDKRLEALGIDSVDLFYIHGLGDDQKSLDEAINYVKGKEIKETADAIRKSGKAKFIGFSTHHKDRAPVIQAAAEAGIIDAIMLMYTPWLDRDAPLNRALDAAHKAGIGLISMKQVAGKFPPANPNENILEKVKQKVRVLAERNLTPYQGLLHAIWTDERITASCVSMKTTDQVRENSDAARRFEPLKVADLRELGDAMLAHNPTLCADCDGRCSVAAGTRAELGNLTRFLTYHQHHGDRVEARRQFAAMPPEAKDWAGADLEAARAACPSGLNFARLLDDVERHLA